MMRGTHRDEHISLTISLPNDREALLVYAIAVVGHTTLPAVHAESDFYAGRASIQRVLDELDHAPRQ